jgi:metal-responsive CopG/Arc/MetJ family transcriptional regulator
MPSSDHDAEPPAPTRITLELDANLVGWLDGMKNQMGLSSRGSVIHTLLRELADISD